MRKRRFSDDPIVAILRESDRTSVAEAAKKHEVSDPTVCVWRKHFQLEMALIDLGKPWQNGVNESFNGKFRDARPMSDRHCP
jgi:transposase-like protein